MIHVHAVFRIRLSYESYFLDVLKIYQEKRAQRVSRRHNPCHNHSSQYCFSSSAARPILVLLQHGLGQTLAHTGRLVHAGGHPIGGSIGICGICGICGIGGGGGCLGILM